jgi:MarR family transcriptional regulator, organic hydroperoxide resistance regulator
MRMLDQAPAVYRLIRVAKQLGVFVGDRLAPLGLHTGQERLLAVLWEQEGLSQSELVARLAVQPPTVTAALQRLEREGFLRREPDPSNRRVSRVYLTDRGRSVEAPVRNIFSEAESRFLGELSAAEREQLVAILDRVGPG